MVNRITEVSQGKLYHYEANYSRYLELKEQRAEMAEASERKRQSILRREREWIQRGCRARSTKSKDRIERYEALRDQSAPEAEAAVQMEMCIRDREYPVPCPFGRAALLRSEAKSVSSR